MRNLQQQAAKNAAPNDENPGESLLRMAAHLAALEESLRPGEIDSQTQVAAWLQVVEQRRKVVDTLSKSDLEKMDGLITAHQVRHLGGILREADRRWHDSALAVLPPDAADAFEKWWQSEHVAIIRQVFREAGHDT